MSEHAAKIISFLQSQILSRLQNIKTHGGYLVGEDKNLCHFIFVIKNKNKDTHYKYTKYTNKTNSALFSGTLGVFSRSIQEIE